MEIEQILQLLEGVSQAELTEFNYEDGSIKLSLKKVSGVEVVNSAVNQSVEVQPVEITTEEALGKEEKEKVIEGQLVKSPLVGTFYTAPSEESDPFVSVGDSVKEGQVLAIVEAMKLMNEIESDFEGTVAEILVSNGETVEYGQPLFVIK